MNRKFKKGDIAVPKEDRIRSYNASFKDVAYLKLLEDPFLQYGGDRHEAVQCSFFINGHYSKTALIYVDSIELRDLDSYNIF